MTVEHHRNPVRAIREFCVWCMGGNPLEPKGCTSEDSCPLWHFRLGKNPYREPPSEAQRESGRRAAARLRRPAQTKKG